MFKFFLTSGSGSQPIVFQYELMWRARIVIRQLFSVFLVETSNILARTKSNKKEAPYPGKGSDQLAKKKIAPMWYFVLISEFLNFRSPPVDNQFCSGLSSCGARAL